MRIGFLSHVYPWITQTFTYREIAGWRQHGLDVEVISFKRPSPQAVATLTPEMRQEVADTIYLTDASQWHQLRGIETVLQQPGATLQGLQMVFREPYLRATTVKLRLQSVLTWLRAMHLASLVAERGYTHIHADFADDTATAALLLHRMTGIPFSFRSHTSYNPQLLAAKLREAQFVLSCSAYDKEQLERVAGRTIGSKVLVNYLGVPCNAPLPRSSPTTPEDDLVLCVGTLQEKKGQHYLIRACARLQREGVRIRCWLVGDGAARAQLQQEILTSGLSEHVRILGYLPNHEVLQLMARASIVCLPCTVADNADLDGIPIVLMEAMALGKACVSTPVSGIPELIEGEADGLLVPERDSAALAKALSRLLGDASLRQRLGASARRKVEHCFNTEQNTREGASVFRCRAGRSAHTETGKPTPGNVEELRARWSPFSR